MEKSSLLVWLQVVFRTEICLFDFLPESKRNSKFQLTREISGQVPWLRLSIMHESKKNICRLKK